MSASLTTVMLAMRPIRRYIAIAMTGRINPPATSAPRVPKIQIRSGARRLPETAPSPMTASRTDRTGARSSLALARCRIVNSATS